MARDAAEDGRPLITFCFCDFDPAGAQMPVSIGRKLQALKVMSFPDLRGQVVPVALTLEQALRFSLPTTPVKAGEKRRGRWQAAYGPALYEAGLIGSPDTAAQVEIDALAALRPDDLRRIAHDSIAPYWDAGLTARTNRVMGNGGSQRKPRSPQRSTRRLSPTSESGGVCGRKLQHGAGGAAPGAGRAFGPGPRA